MDLFLNRISEDEGYLIFFYIIDHGSISAIKSKKVFDNKLGKCF